MVNLDWCVESRAGVTLVELTVENPTEVARRVRVANRLDGPLWPPRREGVPEAGWDDGGFEGVVPPGDRRALGFASPSTPTSSAPPASPAEPPVELVWTERAGRTERPENTESTVEATPEGVVRALGDARPPADAVPTPSRNADAVPKSQRGTDDEPTTPDSRRSP
jgi:hypothetical protein